MRRSFYRKIRELIFLLKNLRLNYFTEKSGNEFLNERSENEIFRNDQSMNFLTKNLIMNSCNEQFRKELYYANNEFLQRKT